MSKELAKIVAPPDRFSRALVNWEHGETVLPTLPDDYKWAIETYGSGCFNRFIRLLTPFSANNNLNLEHQIKLVGEAYSELHRDFGEPKSYSIFPEKGGLMPFGLTDNGDYLFWETVGTPNTWKIVIGAAREPRYESFDMSATDFLAGILSGRIKSSIFPSNFPNGAAIFEPHA